jgi:hypothetical protein
MVNDFVNKVHSGEYIIDNKINDIPYENNESLAQALSTALGNWEGVNSVQLTPSSLHANFAFRVITSAFVHGVVIEKKDLRRTIRETENLLEKCEDEKEKLNMIIEKAKKDLALCKYTNETLRKKLGHKSSDIGDVFHE